jgi:signal transduction histidine kinase
MRQKTASRLAWLLWAATVGLLFGGIVLTVASGDINVDSIVVVFYLFVLAFATVGALVASRRPGNPVGWLLGASAMAYAIGGMASTYEHYALHSRVDPFPVLLWLGNWSYAVGAGLAGTFVFLLFPDGRLPSPRWRPVAWTAGGAIVLLVASIALRPGRFEFERATVMNPFGIRGAEELLSVVGSVGGAALLLSALASIASLFVRFRRGDTVERQQLKWLIYAGGLVIAGVIGSVVAENAGKVDLANALATGALSAIPIAIGIAILKHRLYDIDVVINKTLVYGALAVFITAVYVGVVVGVGSLFGRGDEPNLALSIAATAVVAVAFQPVRARVQHLANRLVFGKRATPYEVLSQFAGRMAGASAPEEVLPRMARTLGEATGATAAQVWLRFDQELRPAASWPDDPQARHVAVPISDGELPILPGASVALPVRHGGELLGALTVVKSTGDRVTPADEKLASHLASQAGLVLRNVRLTEQLQARLKALQASRKRFVAAQDTERRQLERNLHDGAQQQLVALSVKVRLAQQLIARDPEAARPMVETLEEDTQDTLDTLRDLARGIYPRLLAERGLAAALTAQARKTSLPVEVQTDAVGRHPPEAEAAVYFSVLEALQNVAKYADASRATVHLKEGEGGLQFEVRDDGRGFDPSSTGYGTGLQGMVDRLEAVGGTVEVRSAPGAGTSVIGRIPVAGRAE